MENNFNKKIIESNKNGNVKKYTMLEEEACICGNNEYYKQNHKGTTYGICSECNRYKYEYVDYNEFENWIYGEIKQ